MIFILFCMVMMGVVFIVFGMVGKVLGVEIGRGFGVEVVLGMKGGCVGFGLCVGIGGGVIGLDMG